MGSMTQTILRPNGVGAFEELDPEPDTIESIEHLPVDSFDNVRTGWLRIGYSPYLDAIDHVDFTGNYVFQENVDGDEIGDFGYTNSTKSEPITVGVAEVHTEIMNMTYDPVKGDFEALVRIFLWDGSTWHDLGAVAGGNGEYANVIIDVTAILNTLAKVNAAKVYFRYEKLVAPPTDRIYIDFSKLRVVWVYTVRNWENVDEDPSDDDATYVKTLVSKLYKQDSYLKETFTLPPGEVINFVRVYINVRSENPLYPAYFKPKLRTYDTQYGGRVKRPSKVYTVYYEEWATNPYTGKAWTETEVNNSQCGVIAKPGEYKIYLFMGRCTQVYMLVDHTIPIRAMGDGLKWIVS